MKTLLTASLVTTLVTALLSFAPLANADSHYGKKGGYGNHGQKYRQMSDAERAVHMQKRLDRMSAKLGLNDTQKTQFQALKKNSRNEIKPLRNEQRALRKEIRQLNPNADDYAAKLADAANRQAELTRQMIIAKGNKRKQMTNILTTKQLQKKKEMRAKRRAKFHKKKHNRKQ